MERKKFIPFGSIWIDTYQMGQQQQQQRADNKRTDSNWIDSWQVHWATTTANENYLAIVDCLLADDWKIIDDLLSFGAWNSAHSLVAFWCDASWFAMCNLRGSRLLDGQFCEAKMALLLLLLAKFTTNYFVLQCNSNGKLLKKVAMNLLACKLATCNLRVKFRLDCSC